MADQELPTYILAYLLQHDYKETAAAFTQECSLLPSEAVMVFPETTLQNILSEYKAAKDTRVMLSSMGNATAWDVLWRKLDNTIKQMKAMADELFCYKRGSFKGPGGTVYTRKTRLNPAHSPRSTPPLTTSLPPSSSSSSSSSSFQFGSSSSALYKASLQPHSIGSPTNPTSFSFTSHMPVESDTGRDSQATTAPAPYSTAVAQLPSAPQAGQSPHKRKTAPKRKLPESPYKPGPPPGIESQPSSSSSTAPTMQLLETFLGDNLLPEKLAEIINRCVTTKEVVAMPSEKEQEKEEEEDRGGSLEQPQQVMGESEQHQLSPSTMENIFNLTFSDPIFEGILAPSDGAGMTLPHSSSSSSILTVPQNSSIEDSATLALPSLSISTSTSEPQASTSTQQYQKATLKLGSLKEPFDLSSMAGNDAAIECATGLTVAEPSLRCRPVEVKVIDKDGVDTLPAKRPKLSENDDSTPTAGLPSDLDIERFLDRIHK